MESYKRENPNNPNLENSCKMIDFFFNPFLDHGYYYSGFVSCGSEEWEEEECLGYHQELWGWKWYREQSKNQGWAVKSF